MNQESNRLMCAKVEIEVVILKVFSGYVPQVGCELEEKEKFWNALSDREHPQGRKCSAGSRL